MFLLQPRVLLAFVLYFVLINNSPLLAQPGDELSLLRQQLRQIQDRIENLQKSGGDPFGSRVRAVGRQRTATPPPVAQDDLLVIRFYDLSDIFSVAPQYPARLSNDFISGPQLVFRNVTSDAAQDGLQGGGGFGGGGGGGFGGADSGGVFNIPPSMFKQQQAQTMSLSAARVSVGRLINAIQSAVAPDEWVDTNGEASINVLGNTLLISATDSMHEQIANLLNLIREHWGKLKTVSVDAYWIRSNSKEILELLGNRDKNRVVGKVDADKWQTFYQASFSANRIAYSANIVGHNGQTLNAISGHQSLMVVDVEPLYSVTGYRNAVENDDEELFVKSVAGFRPIRNLFHEGAIIQVSPLATRGGNYLILDLHTRVNELIETAAKTDAPPIGPKTLARDANGQEISLPLDDAKYRTHRLSTTVRCPNGAVLLVGGMAFESNLQDDQSPNLYLFVRGRIHKIEEDQPVPGDYQD